MARMERIGPPATGPSSPQLRIVPREQSGHPATTTPILHTRAGGHIVDAQVRSATHAALLARGRRTASLAFVLAGMLAMPEKERVSIALAATVCDLGMLFLPQHMRTTGARLRASDRQIVQSHVRAGYDLLMMFAERTQRDLSLEANIVLAHHELYDGHGYPNGRAGRYIPAGARIICIADAFLGLTQDEGYAPCGREEALEIMASDSGAAYDPHFFDVFRNIIRQKTDLLFREYAKLFGSTSRLSELAHGILGNAAALAKKDADFLL